MVICHCGKETGHDKDHKACDEEMNDRDGADFTCWYCGEQLYEHEARAGLEDHPKCVKRNTLINLPGHE